MGFAHRMGSASIAALSLLAGAALAQAPPPGDRVITRFEVFGPAGLHVVTSRTEIAQTAEHYKIVSDLATRGVASIVVDLSDHSEVRGRLVAGSALPEAFRSTSRRNGEDRRDRVDYHSDGTIQGSASPPPLTPIEPSQMRDTVDNLTAYFRVERRIGRGGNCTFRVAVYDARLRYDLHYTDRGEQMLSASGGQRFAGAAHACHMRRVEIAGFPGDPKVSEGAREGTIWYARLMPGDLVVPVRMELETEIGVVSGYLAELHGRGVDLKLME